MRDGEITAKHCTRKDMEGRKEERGGGAGKGRAVMPPHAMTHLISSRSVGIRVPQLE